MRTYGSLPLLKFRTFSPQYSSASECGRARSRTRSKLLRAPADSGPNHMLSDQTGPAFYQIRSGPSFGRSWCRVSLRENTRSPSAERTSRKGCVMRHPTRTMRSLLSQTARPVCAFLSSNRTTSRRSISSGRRPSRPCPSNLAASKTDSFTISAQAMSPALRTGRRRIR